MTNRLFIITLRKPKGNSMARENKSRYAILGLLSHMPLSGYDIKKWTDTSLNFFWSENYGHIYPLLKELEKDGLATGKKAGSTKGPERKVFSITPKGKRVFLSWLKAAENPEKYRVEILLKLFFSRALTPPEIQTKLEGQVRQNEELLARYRDVEAHFKEIPDPGMKLAAGITLDYGKAYSQMIIDWAKKWIKTISKLPS